MGYIEVEFPDSKEEEEFGWLKYWKEVKHSDIPYSEKELIERVIRNARVQKGKSRRVQVTRVFGVGSPVAEKICLKYGFDPEEKV